MIFSKILVSKQIWCHGLKGENNFHTVQSSQKSLPSIVHISVYNKSKRMLSSKKEQCQIEKLSRSSALKLTGIGLGLYLIYRKDALFGTLFAVSGFRSKRDLKIKGLRTYTLDEIKKHNSKSERIWVTYSQGVYDISDFIDRHPGGREKIMMAAGSSVEPYWMLYRVHNKKEVLSLLETFRIGNVKEEEEDSNKGIEGMEDPYALEPRRHPSLIPGSYKPFNAEPPPSLLVENFITPTNLFYVRNHHAVPSVELRTYELEINGLGTNGKIFSLLDIQTKFPKVTVSATIQCAGNRRSEMVKVKPVRGLNWGHAAIGNATWSGARLCDVLKAAGVKENEPGAKHVQFEGLDVDVTNTPYGASIPFSRAINPNSDIILAYEMNGKPLTRDHGFPLRVVVPGIVGARNVKWLTRIEISEEESLSIWQQKDYKGFSPSVDWACVDFKTSPAIQELPVNSAICDPSPGSKVKLKNGNLVIRGYAWSGGGREIIRVDITINEGKTWLVAKLAEDEKCLEPSRCWGWKLWTAEVPIEKTSKEVEIWAKAVDSSYNTQPEKVEHIWNIHGVLSNAYHKVKVNVVQK